MTNASRQVGRTIREVRTRLGRSLKQVSLDASCSASYLSDIERGLKSPTIAYLEAICKTLGVPMRSLFPEDPKDFEQVMTNICGVCPILDRSREIFDNIRSLAQEAIRVMDETSGAAE